MSSTSPKREGSVILPGPLIDFAYSLADLAAKRLSAMHVRPNQVTATSLLVAALSGLSLANGRPMVGAGFLVVASLCDLLDGHLARSFGYDSSAGAFLDSVTDRITEAFVFIGLAYWGGGGPLTWLAIWALVASLAISYARARGEALGVECAVGLMQRPERLVLLVVTLLVAPLIGFGWDPGTVRPVLFLVLTGVGALAVLSTITAFRRARWIFRRLQAVEAASEPSESRPVQHESRPDAREP